MKILTFWLQEFDLFTDLLFMTKIMFLKKKINGIKMQKLLEEQVDMVGL